MANIVEIRYTRKFNLGNYESEDIGATALVSEGESPAKVLAEMKEFISNPGAKEKAPEAAPAPAPVKAKVEKAKEKVAEAEPKKVEAKEEEVAAPKATKTKAFKSKATPYSRSNDLHKKLVAEFLDKSFPKWKTSLLAKAKAASVSMEGKDMLDSEGVLLESFKKAYSEAMSEK